MSGRNGGSSGSGIMGVLGLIFLGICFLTGFLLLLIWPLFILYGYIKRAASIGSISNIEPTPKWFWFTREEKKEYVALAGMVRQAEKDLEHEQTEFDAMPRVRRNKDGSFDKRSDAGKVLDWKEGQVKKAMSNYRYLDNRLDALSKEPRDRFYAWLKKTVDYKAYRFTLFFTLIFVPFYVLVSLHYLGFEGESLMNAYVFYALSAPLKVMDGVISIQGYFPVLSVLFADKYMGFEFLWKQWALVMVVPPLLPLIPHMIFASMCESNIKEKAVIPPVVTLENLPDYIFVEDVNEEASAEKDSVRQEESVDETQTGQPSISAASGLVERFDSFTQDIEQSLAGVSEPELLDPSGAQLGQPKKSGPDDTASSQGASKPQQPQEPPVVPHILWRLLACGVSLLSVSFMLGGILFVLEKKIGLQQQDAKAMVVLCLFLLSIPTAFYWNIKKAKKQRHLWLWQVGGSVGILALALVFA